jgi:hypothetical protein
VLHRPCLFIFVEPKIGARQQFHTGLSAIPLDHSNGSFYRDAHAFRAFPNAVFSERPSADSAHAIVCGIAGAIYKNGKFISTPPSYQIAGQELVPQLHGKLFQKVVAGMCP